MCCEDRDCLEKGEEEGDIHNYSEDTHPAIIYAISVLFQTGMLHGKNRMIDRDRYNASGSDTCV